MEWFHATLTVLTALLPGGVHVRCTCGGEGRRDGLDAKCQKCTITYTSCDVSLSSGAPTQHTALRHSTCTSVWNPLRLQWAFSAAAGLLCAVKQYR